MSKSRRIYWCLAVLAAGVLGFAASNLARFPSVQPNDRPVRRLSKNVLEFGAVGDGVHDDTGAFQDALQAATAQQPGTSLPYAGARVDVPPGKYVLKRQLQLHDVLLMGLAAGGWPADGDSMPVLILDHNEVGVVLYDDASVHGLTFRRSRSMAARAKHGTRETAIELDRPGNSVTNVKIYDAYDGIVCRPPGPHMPNPGRLHVAQVFVISPVHCGIDIQNTRDTALVENCQVWCPDENHRAKFGYRFGGNDGLRCAHLFAYNCETGFELYASQDGTSFWGSLENCGADRTSTAIDVSDGTFISITGGTFLCHNNGIVLNAPAAQVTISGATFQVNAGSALIAKNVKQLSCVGIAAFRGMPTNSPLIDLQRGRAITLSGSTIDTRAIGTGIRCDNRGAIGALSIVGNSFTVFQAADPKSSLQPKAIDREPAGPPRPQDIVVANNAGIIPRPQPAALSFEQLAVAANRWGIFHGFVAAIPNGKDDAAMVSTGFIGIRRWAADIRNASTDELTQLLAQTGKDLASPEGRILAADRWARTERDANGEDYKAGWPNSERKGQMYGVICFKTGVKAMTYRLADIGNASGVADRIAKLSAWCGRHEQAGGACLPTFESNQDGALGAILLRNDDVSPDERIGQEELQAWLRGRQ